MRRRFSQLVSRSDLIPVRPARNRDARPLHSERPCGRLSVRRIVQHRKDVMEQVLDVRSDAFEAVLGGSRQVGPTLDSVPFDPQSFVAEPCGEHTCAPLAQVERCDLCA